MSLFDFRRIDEFNSAGKFDPRAVLALDSGLIVVGTFDGHLEIYGKKSADEKIRFINNLKFESPILQIKPFHYANQTHQETIVILCPRRLIGIKIEISDNGVSEEFKANLKYIFEHKFTTDTYTIEVGGFDGINLKSDFIFSLSLCGLLQLFQNETKIYEVQIPNLLFPSPLIYSPLHDSLIIQNRPFSVSSYLQNTLAIMAESQKTKFVSQWECELPELITDIILIDDKSTLFCKGTQSVFLVGADSGHLLRQLQLEGIRIRSMLIYQYQKSLMQIYLSENNKLLVYRGAKKLWSSGTNMDVIGLKRLGDGSPHAGAILLLGRQWQLRLGYLGTRPQLRLLEPSDEKRNTLAEINTQISRAEAVLADEVTQRQSTKNAFSLTLMLNPSIHDNSIIDFKVNFTPMVEIDHASISVSTPTDEFDVEFEDGDELSMMKQSVTGRISMPSKGTFLNLSIVVSVSATTADNEHQIFSVQEDIPTLSWLRKIDSSSLEDKKGFKITLETGTQALSSIFEEYGIENSTFDSESNQIYFLVNGRSEVVVRNCSGQMEFVSMELASLLILIKFVAKQLKSPKELRIIQNPKIENKIFGQFERIIQRIDQLASTDKELKTKLNIQMKFLTALEKKLLAKVKLANQLESTNMDFLINQGLESISALRRALLENMELRRQSEMEALAAIQLIFLISFIKQKASQESIFKLLENFRIQGTSDEPFLQRLEKLLGYLGHRFGSNFSTTNQIDSGRIKKRLTAIMTRLSPSTVADLFRPVESKLMRNVPLKGEESSTIGDQKSSLHREKVKKEVPKDFEEHMKLLQQ